jgi:hypothetical protein
MPTAPPDAHQLPVFGAIFKCVKMGRNENVSAPFHVSSQAVTGRLACLTVVPALVILSVTPPPE